jgi:hypothetical protein
LRKLDVRRKKWLYNAGINRVLTVRNRKLSGCAWSNTAKGSTGLKTGKNARSGKMTVTKELCKAMKDRGTWSNKVCVLCRNRKRCKEKEEISIYYPAGIEPTGYCWKCGHPCLEDKLFCSDKHKQAYLKKQKRNIDKQKGGQ